MEMSILRIELEDGMQEEILDYLEKNYKSLVDQIRKNGHIKILQKTRGILKETSVGKVSGPMLRYQDGRSTETLMIPLFGREKEVPMEGYAQVRGKTGPRVRMQADKAPSGMARTLALLSGGKFLSTLYILQTYSVRVHESSRVWDYTVGEEREGYKVLGIEDNTVYLGYDEKWYFSSVVPEERWFPDAPVPFIIEQVVPRTVVFVQGIAIDRGGFYRRGLTFHPWVKYDEEATRAWKWHKNYDGTRGVLSDALKVFRVDLSDLSPEALSILIGKVEGDMNKLFLRGLTKGFRSRLEYDDYVSTREEINREQDEEIISELRLDAKRNPKTGDPLPLNCAPRKLNRKGNLRQQERFSELDKISLGPDMRSSGEKSGGTLGGARDDVLREAEKKGVRERTSKRGVTPVVRKLTYDEYVSKKKAADKARKMQERLPERPIKARRVKRGGKLGSKGSKNLRL